MPTLDRPPRELLTVARVRGLLAWVSHRSRLPDAALARVPALVGSATIDQDPRAADPRIAFVDGVELALRVDARCGCPTDATEGFCEHRAAIVVIALWRREGLRDLFARPCWQLELDYLVRERPREGLTETAPPPRSDRACRLQVQLFATGGYAQGFDFELWLVRANKRGDGWLKPIRCPLDRDKLLAKARPTPAQLRICDLVAQLAELRKVDAFARTAPKLRSRVAHELLAAFEQAGDEVELRWEAIAIAASTRSFAPVLRVSSAGPGRLEARWAEGVRDHWRLDPSIVLTTRDLLRPLAEGVPPHLLDRATEAAPVVLDIGEFDELARTILAHAPVTIELPDPSELGPLGRVQTVARTLARVYLSERGEILRCTPKLAYELADGRRIELGIRERGSLLIRDDLTLARDATWEQARRDEFEAEVGRESSVELLAEGAWSFLAETLPGLRERGWEVFGEAALTHNRVLARPLAPRTRLGPSTDWFDLEIDFIAEPGSPAVPAPAVIDSWLAGDRFVKLPDERIAALPTRWLDRHGRALAELAELRRAPGTERGLGLHALPLASDLLAELDASTAADGDPEQRRRIDHWNARADALASFAGLAEREVPPGLRATLRDYQRRGFAWLCFLRDHGLGGCLADDMGLGKTIQALALLLDTHVEPRGVDGPPSLVVCPTSVLHTWREQAARFAPELRVHLHHGPRRGQPPETGVDVILTSYALLRRDAEPVFRSRRLRHAIFDEAQALKNPDSQVAEAARSLDAAHVVALTGTPLENDVVELWSLFELLMPGFFGSRRRFKKRWAEAIHARADAAALARLRRRVRPFLLRRLKREVAAELPPKQIQVLRCRLGRDQRQIYERVRQTYRASVFGAVEQRGVAGATLHILEALTRLRQACCHPALLPFPEAREHGGHGAKIELLRLLLGQAIADGHRSLVFSQWPSFLDLVAAALDHDGVAYLRLDGRTRDRAEVLARWRDVAGPPVFLISMKAGGLGLDLTEADHVFHLDPWWNPAAEDQATDRAHRIGQTRPVMVYELVAADTVEDKILELQARKRRLFRATIDTDRLEVDRFGREDLEAVFGDPDGPLDFDDDDDDDDDDSEGADRDPRSLAELVALPRAEDGPPPAPAAPGEQTGDVIELFPQPSADEPIFE